MSCFELPPAIPGKFYVKPCEKASLNFEYDKGIFNIRPKQGYWLSRESGSKLTLRKSFRDGNRRYSPIFEYSTKNGKMTKIKRSDAASLLSHFSNVDLRFQSTERSKF